MYSNPDRRPVKAKAGRKVGKKLETVKKDVVKDLFSKGLKQTDIVKQTGISKGYVSKIVKESKQ